MKDKKERFYLIGTTRSGNDIKIPESLSKTTLADLLSNWAEHKADLIDIYSLSEYLLIWFSRHPSEAKLFLPVQLLSTTLNPLIYSSEFYLELKMMNLKTSADFVRLGQRLAVPSLRSD